MKKTAKFNVGDCVVHTQHGYRAVVVDVDPFFQASGRFNPQARKSEFALRNPWYRLLVDKSSQMTYVEEPLLTIDSSHLAIDNPKIGHYLKEQKGGYQTNSSLH